MRRRVIPAFALLLLTMIGQTPVSHAQFQGGAGNRGQNPRDVQIQTQSVQPAAPLDPPPLETDLVLLTVSVTGPEDKSVPTLSSDRFQILEDGVEQKISYFWVDNRPISVGLLVDDSDYMSLPDSNSKEASVRTVLPSFLKSKSPADEYFVIQFSTFPRMTISYTSDAKLAPTTFRVVSGTPTPDTALYDAIYLGLESIKEAANPRKALLVITGGGDKGCDGSKIVQTMKPDQLLAFAIKQPVQIYTMLIADDWGTANGGMPCEQIPTDANNLDLLASTTGGKSYLAPNAEGGVNAIAIEVARALKTQYLIGYKSTNTAKDGKRRGVKVKVNPPEGSPKLKVWTKSSYIAPKEKSTSTTN